MFHLQRQSGCSAAKSRGVAAVLQGVVVGQVSLLRPELKGFAFLLLEVQWGNQGQSWGTWGQAFPALGPPPPGTSHSCLGDFLPKESDLSKRLLCGLQPSSSSAHKHFCQASLPDSPPPLSVPGAWACLRLLQASSLPLRLGELLSAAQGMTFSPH